MKWMAKRKTKHWSVFDEAGGYVVVNSEGRPSAEAAALIAAAPDLLAACKTALETLRAWNEMSMPAAQRKLVAETYEKSPEIQGLIKAIAKAEGGHNA